MAFFGYVVSKNGFYDNQELINNEWLKESLIDYRNEPDVNWGDLKNVGYGYLWWLGEINGYRTQLAIGHGGQFIIMIRELDLVIVNTAEAYVYWDKADEQERDILDLVANYILPAIINY